MAKFKKASKTTKKASRKRSASSADARAQAERLSKSLSESAQQIWQAGVGAFGRAQEEGSKLFEGLVKEGLNLEQSARRFAGGRADVVRDRVENSVGQARDRATDTWDRLEKVFEDRVQRALTRLGVPGRDDLNDLSDRVEELTGELRRQNGTGARRPAAAKATKAAKKTAAAKGATKPAVRKATKKTAAKSAAKSGRKAPAKKAGPASRTTAPATKRPARKAAKTPAKPSIVAPSAPVAPTASDA